MNGGSRIDRTDWLEQMRDYLDSVDVQIGRVECMRIIERIDSWRCGGGSIRRQIVNQLDLQRVPRPRYHQRTGKSGIIGAGAQAERSQLPLGVSDLERIRIDGAGGRRGDIAAPAQHRPSTHRPSSQQQLSSRHGRSFRHVIPFSQSGAARGVGGSSAGI